MKNIASYPSIRALGHRDIAGIFMKPVVVEEKVDGSQISFGWDTGELIVRSKNQRVDIAEPNMFKAGVDAIMGQADELRAGYTYRGEYLAKPKHNTLCYDRVPKNHIAIFDIETAPGQHYLTPEEKRAEAERIGFEAVPTLTVGQIEAAPELFALLDTVSFLGGNPIEGFVVKQYDNYTTDGKIMIGKYVSEGFKEVHRVDWKNRNPTRADIIDVIIAQYATPARWQKAVQHLEERGELGRDPRDIGKLMKEVSVDVFDECADDIKDQLFRHFWNKIHKALGRGLPGWYKNKLAEEAFGPEANLHDVPFLMTGDPVLVDD